MFGNSQRTIAAVGALLASCPHSSAFAVSMTNMAGSAEKLKLFDVPVSNHGAQCRFIIYEKNVEDQVDVVSPMSLGGLKSPEYLKLNPHGKMPLISTPDCGDIVESDTICRYLVETFDDKGSSFRPATKEGRMREAQITRLFDMYINPILGCLYKASPPFGIHSDRTAAIADLENQLEIFEGLASAGGPFLAGEGVSLADSAAWPTIVFIRFMMPKFDRTDFLGPKLSAWCSHMEKHPAGKRVQEEIVTALEKWDANGRWDTILHAGKRDKEPPTVFDKILAKEIPCTPVFEDDTVLAFRDINPVAPTHVLIIPKRRNGLTQLRHATADHAAVLGHMLEVAAKIAAEEKLEGFRVAINDGAKGGQEVFHLHMHLIGGGEGMDKLGKMCA